ncbi:unnamed protein product [Polarella glacialis]|uniref:Protein kinase domain-containing protein n=1 Tax=Polarella glacialis TaxID=89957 RepID=A0A813JJ21_POLGL|nr:unnamed protein product [Polarella glacialis]
MPVARPEQIGAETGYEGSTDGDRVKFIKRLLSALSQRLPLRLAVLAGGSKAQAAFRSQPIVFFDFDRTLTLRRLAELGPAWIEQAFGGLLLTMLEGLVASGRRVVLVTRGYVGVARKCLLEVYGNIGTAYGSRTEYDQESEQGAGRCCEEMDRLWGLLGKWGEGEWDSKTEIVHRYRQEHGLDIRQVMFVDDDLAELEPVRHANWLSLRDPLASKPFAITIFNRKHLPVRVNRYLCVLEAEFAARKSGLRRFTLLLREPLLLWSMAQDAYVQHVTRTGDSRFEVSALAPAIRDMQAQLGVDSDDGHSNLAHAFGSHQSFSEWQRNKSSESEAACPADIRVSGVTKSDHLYEEPLVTASANQPMQALSSMVRLFRQTLVGLCPITMATAGRHRNSICCHEVRSLSEYDAVWVRYGKLKLVGAGHFGEVFQATELCSMQDVAVKSMERLPEEEEGSADEVSVLRALAHPNLLRVFEVVRFPGKVLLVTELAPGGSLSVYARKNGVGLWIHGAMQQIVSAVAYCHRLSVLHGDLKPENVLTSGARPDGSPLCIVCDFGHTTVCIGSALVAAPGDPRYIAPEVVAKEGLSSKSDIYMLGVTAFELLTGGWLPFFNEKSVSLSMSYHQLGRGGVHERILSEKGLDWRDLERLRAACTVPGVNAVVLSMLARHAEDRPSALEVLKTDWLHDAHMPCKSAYDAMIKTGANTGWGLWGPQHPCFAERLTRRAELSWTYRMLLSLIGAGLSPVRLHGARLLFRRMDEVGDGTVGLKSFCKVAVAAGLSAEASEALFIAGDLHNQKYLDFKNLVMIFLDVEGFSQDELLAELRSLVNRIRGPVVASSEQVSATVLEKSGGGGESLLKREEGGEVGADLTQGRGRYSDTGPTDAILEAEPQVLDPRLKFVDLLAILDQRPDARMQR